MKYKLYYLTSSLDNNKLRYVGYTTDIERRLKEHINESKYQKSKSHKINWITKLIRNNILPEIVFMEGTDSLDRILNKEISHIKFLNIYYNLTNSTSGGEVSKTIRKDVREKISNSLKKYYETHDGWNKGLTHSFSDERNEKRRLKMGDVTKGENNHFYGKKHSEETLKILSMKNKKYEYNYDMVFNLYIRQNLNGSEVGKEMGIPGSRMNRIIRKYNLMCVKKEIYGKIKGKKEKVYVNFDDYHKKWDI